MAQRGEDGPKQSIPDHLACTLCGSRVSTIQCTLCFNRSFCLTCNDAYHQHPKRQSHLQRPVPPPRLKTGSRSSLLCPPTPPIRKKSRSASSLFAARSSGAFAASPTPPPRKRKIAGSSRSQTQSPALPRKQPSLLGPIERPSSTGAPLALANRGLEAMSKACSMPVVTTSSPTPLFDLSSRPPVIPPRIRAPRYTPPPLMAHPQKNGGGLPGVQSSSEMELTTRGYSLPRTLYTSSAHPFPHHPFASPEPLMATSHSLAHLNCPQCLASHWATMGSAAPDQRQVSSKESLNAPSSREGSRAESFSPRPLSEYSDEDNENFIPADTNKAWACRHCTYINEPGAKICDVCSKTHTVARRRRRRHPRPRGTAEVRGQSTASDLTSEREEESPERARPYGRPLIVPSDDQREEDGRKSPRAVRRSPQGDSEAATAAEGKRHAAQAPVEPTNLRVPSLENRDELLVWAQQSGYLQKSLSHTDLDSVIPSEKNVESNVAPSLRRHQSFEELFERTKPPGIEILDMVRRAGERGYSLDEVEVALAQCGSVGMEPLDWLDRYWTTVVDMVASMVADHTDPGGCRASRPEAREALFQAKGEVLPALAQCVETRRTKVEALLRSMDTPVPEERLFQLLTAHGGDVDQAMQSLNLDKEQKPEAPHPPALQIFARKTVVQPEAQICPDDIKICIEGPDLTPITEIPSPAIQEIKEEEALKIPLSFSTQGVEDKSFEDLLSQMDIPQQDLSLSDYEDINLRESQSRLVQIEEVPEEDAKNVQIEEVGHLKDIHYASLKEFYPPESQKAEIRLQPCPSSSEPLLSQATFDRSEETDRSLTVNLFESQEGPSNISKKFVEIEPRECNKTFNSENNNEYVDMTASQSFDMAVSEEMERRDDLSQAHRPSLDKTSSKDDSSLTNLHRHSTIMDLSQSEVSQSDLLQVPRSSEDKEATSDPSSSPSQRGTEQKVMPESFKIDIPDEKGIFEISPQCQGSLSDIEISNLTDVDLVNPQTFQEPLQDSLPSERDLDYHIFAEAMERNFYGSLMKTQLSHLPLTEPRENNNELEKSEITIVSKEGENMIVPSQEERSSLVDEEQVESCLVTEKEYSNQKDVSLGKDVKRIGSIPSEIIINEDVNKMETSCATLQKEDYTIPPQNDQAICQADKNGYNVECGEGEKESIFQTDLLDRNEELKESYVNLDDEVDPRIFAEAMERYCYESVMATKMESLQKVEEEEKMPKVEPEDEGPGEEERLKSIQMEVLKQLSDVILLPGSSTFIPEDVNVYTDILQKEIERNIIERLSLTEEEESPENKHIIKEACQEIIESEVERQVYEKVTGEKTEIGAPDITKMTPEEYKEALYLEVEKFIYEKLQVIEEEDVDLRSVETFQNEMLEDDTETICEEEREALSATFEKEILDRTIADDTHDDAAAFMEAIKRRIYENWVLTEELTSPSDMGEPDDEFESALTGETDHYSTAEETLHSHSSPDISTSETWHTPQEASETGSEVWCSPRRLSSEFSCDEFRPSTSKSKLSTQKSDKDKNEKPESDIFAGETKEANKTEQVKEPRPPDIIPRKKKMVETQGKRHPNGQMEGEDPQPLQRKKKCITESEVIYQCETLETSNLALPNGFSSPQDDQKIDEDIQRPLSLPCDQPLVVVPSKQMAIPVEREKLDGEALELHAVDLGYEQVSEIKTLIAQRTLPKETPSPLKVVEAPFMVEDELLPMFHMRRGKLVHHSSSQEEKTEELNEMDQPLVLEQQSDPLKKERTTSRHEEEKIPEERFSPLLGEEERHYVNIETIKQRDLKHLDDEMREEIKTDNDDVRLKESNKEITFQASNLVKSEDLLSKDTNKVELESDANQIPQKRKKSTKENEPYQTTLILEPMSTFRSEEEIIDPHSRKDTKGDIEDISTKTSVVTPSKINQPTPSNDLMMGDICQPIFEEQDDISHIAPLRKKSKSSSFTTDDNNNLAIESPLFTEIRDTPFGISRDVDSVSNICDAFPITSQKNESPAKDNLQIESLSLEYDHEVEKENILETSSNKLCKSSQIEEEMIVAPPRRKSSRSSSIISGEYDFKSFQTEDGTPILPPRRKSRASSVTSQDYDSRVLLMEEGIPIPPPKRRSRASSVSSGDFCPQEIMEAEQIPIAPPRRRSRASSVTSEILNEEKVLKEEPNYENTTASRDFDNELKHFTLDEGANSTSFQFFEDILPKDDAIQVTSKPGDAQEFSQVHKEKSFQKELKDLELLTNKLIEREDPTYKIPNKIDNEMVDKADAQKLSEFSLEIESDSRTDQNVISMHPGDPQKGLIEAVPKVDSSGMSFKEITDENKEAPNEISESIPLPLKSESQLPPKEISFLKDSKETPLLASEVKLLENVLHDKMLGEIDNSNKITISDKVPAQSLLTESQVSMKEFSCKNVDKKIPLKIAEMVLEAENFQEPTKFEQADGEASRDKANLPSYVDKDQNFLEKSNLQETSIDQIYPQQASIRAISPTLTSNILSEDYYQNLSLIDQISGLSDGAGMKKDFDSPKFPEKAPLLESDKGFTEREHGDVFLASNNDLLLEEECREDILLSEAPGKVAGKAPGKTSMAALLDMDVEPISTASPPLAVQVNSSKKDIQIPPQEDHLVEISHQKEKLIIGKSELSSEVSSLVSEASLHKVSEEAPIPVEKNLDIAQESVILITDEKERKIKYEGEKINDIKLRDHGTIKTLDDQEFLCEKFDNVSSVIDTKHKESLSLEVEDAPRLPEFSMPENDSIISENNKSDTKELQDKPKGIVLVTPGKQSLDFLSAASIEEKSKEENWAQSKEINMDHFSLLLDNKKIGSPEKLEQGDLKSQNDLALTPDITGVHVKVFSNEKLEVPDHGEEISQDEGSVSQVQPLKLEKELSVPIAKEEETETGKINLDAEEEEIMIGSEKLVTKVTKLEEELKEALICEEQQHNLDLSDNAFEQVGKGEVLGLVIEKTIEREFYVEDKSIQPQSTHQDETPPVPLKRKKSQLSRSSSKQQIENIDVSHVEENFKKELAQASDQMQVKTAFKEEDDSNRKKEPSISGVIVEVTDLKSKEDNKIHKIGVLELSDRGRRTSEAEIYKDALEYLPPVPKRKKKAKITKEPTEEEFLDAFDTLPGTCDLQKDVSDENFPLKGMQKVAITSKLKSELQEKESHKVNLAMQKDGIHVLDDEAPPKVKPRRKSRLSRTSSQADDEFQNMMESLADTEDSEKPKPQPRQKKNISRRSSTAEDDIKSTSLFTEEEAADDILPPKPLPRRKSQLSRSSSKADDDFRKIIITEKSTETKAADEVLDSAVERNKIDSEMIPKADEINDKLQLEKELKLNKEIRDVQEKNYEKEWGSKIKKGDEGKEMLENENKIDKLKRVGDELEEDSKYEKKKENRILESPGSFEDELMLVEKAEETIKHGKIVKELAPPMAVIFHEEKAKRVIEHEKAVEDVTIVENTFETKVENAMKVGEIKMPDVEPSSKISDQIKDNELKCGTERDNSKDSKNSKETDFEFIKQEDEKLKENKVLHLGDKLLSSDIEVMPEPKPPARKTKEKLSKSSTNKEENLKEIVLMDNKCLLEYQKTGINDDFNESEDIPSNSDQNQASDVKESLMKSVEKFSKSDIHLRQKDELPKDESLTSKLIESTNGSEINEETKIKNNFFENENKFPIANEDEINIESREEKKSKDSRSQKEIKKSGEKDNDLKKEKTEDNENTKNEEKEALILPEAGLFKRNDLNDDKSENNENKLLKKEKQQEKTNKSLIDESINQFEDKIKMEDIEKEMQSYREEQKIVKIENETTFDEQERNAIKDIIQPRKAISSVSEDQSSKSEKCFRNEEMEETENLLLREKERVLSKAIHKEEKITEIQEQNILPMEQVQEKEQTYKKSEYSLPEEEKEIEGKRMGKKKKEISQEQEKFKDTSKEDKASISQEKEEIEKKSKKLMEEEAKKQSKELIKATKNKHEEERVSEEVLSKKEKYQDANNKMLDEPKAKSHQKSSDHTSKLEVLEETKEARDKDKSKINQKQDAKDKFTDSSINEKKSSDQVKIIPQLNEKPYDKPKDEIPQNENFTTTKDILMDENVESMCKQQEKDEKRLEDSAKTKKDEKSILSLKTRSKIPEDEIPHDEILSNEKQRSEKERNETLGEEKEKQKVKEITNDGNLIKDTLQSESDNFLIQKEEKVSNKRVDEACLYESFDENKGKSIEKNKDIKDKEPETKVSEKQEKSNDHEMVIHSKGKVKEKDENLNVQKEIGNKENLEIISTKEKQDKALTPSQDKSVINEQVDYKDDKMLLKDKTKRSMDKDEKPIASDESDKIQKKEIIQNDTKSEKNKGEKFSISKQRDVDDVAKSLHSEEKETRKDKDELAKRQNQRELKDQFIKGKETGLPKEEEDRSSKVSSNEEEKIDIPKNNEITEVKSSREIKDESVKDGPFEDNKNQQEGNLRIQDEERGESLKSHKDKKCLTREEKDENVIQSKEKEGIQLQDESSIGRKLDEEEKGLKDEETIKKPKKPISPPREGKQKSKDESFKDESVKDVKNESDLKKIKDLIKNENEPLKEEKVEIGKKESSPNETKKDIEKHKAEILSAQKDSKLEDIIDLPLKEQDEEKGDVPVKKKKEKITKPFQEQNEKIKENEGKSDVLGKKEKMTEPWQEQNEKIKKEDSSFENKVEDSKRVGEVNEKEREPKTPEKRDKKKKGIKVSPTDDVMTNGDSMKRSGSEVNESNAQQKELLGDQAKSELLQDKKLKKEKSSEKEDKEEKAKHETEALSTKTEIPLDSQQLLKIPDEQKTDILAKSEKEKISEPLQEKNGQMKKEVDLDSSGSRIKDKFSKTKTKENVEFEPKAIEEEYAKVPSKDGIKKKGDSTKGLVIDVDESSAQQKELDGHSKSEIGKDKKWKEKKSQEEKDKKKEKAIRETESVNGKSEIPIDSQVSEIQEKQKADVLVKSENEKINEPLQEQNIEVKEEVDLDSSRSRIKDKFSKKKDDEIVEDEPKAPEKMEKDAKVPAKDEVKKKSDSKKGLSPDVESKAQQKELDDQSKNEISQDKKMKKEKILEEKEKKDEKAKRETETLQHSKKKDVESKAQQKEFDDQSKNEISQDEKLKKEKILEEKEKKDEKAKHETETLQHSKEKNLESKAQQKELDDQSKNEISRDEKLKKEKILEEKEKKDEKAKRETETLQHSKKKDEQKTDILEKKEKQEPRESFQEQNESVKIQDRKIMKEEKSREGKDEKEEKSKHETETLSSEKASKLETPKDLQLSKKKDEQKADGLVKKEDQKRRESLQKQNELVKKEDELDSSENRIKGKTSKIQAGESEAVPESKPLERRDKKKKDVKMPPADLEPKKNGETKKKVGIDVNELNGQQNDYNEERRKSVMAVRRLSKSLPEFTKEGKLLKERAEQLFLEGRFPTMAKCEMAAKLLEMQFEPDDALRATRHCSAIYWAVKFLQQRCDLCGGKYPVNMMASMVHCYHRACRECIKAHFTTQINDRSVLRLSCPHGCQPDLSLEKVALEYFDQLDFLLKQWLDPETHELFRAKLRNRALIPDPNFHWCSQCSSGYLAEPRMWKMTCPDCGSTTCSQCHRPWESDHEGRSCDAFCRYKFSKKPEVQVTRLITHLERIGIIHSVFCPECPKCSHLYHLAKVGSLYFYCGRCKHVFCPGCHQPYLRRNGLDKADHPRNCLFFQRYLSVPDLQQLLAANKVIYHSKYPDILPLKPRCQIMEQKEKNGGFTDDICGRPTSREHGGLCRSHYVEYLVGLVNQHGLDPILAMDTSDVTFFLRQAQHQIPEKFRGERNRAYKNRLLRILEAEYPMAPLNSLYVPHFL